MGKVQDLLDAVERGADAVAMADILHYKRTSLNEIRAGALSAGIRVRTYE
jgi:cyclase